MRSANSRREDAGVLRLVLLQDVGLHGAADVREHVRPDPRVGLRRDHVGRPRCRAAPSPRPSWPGGSSAVVARQRRVRRRSARARAREPPVSRRCRSTAWSMAAFRKNASTHRRRTVDRHRDRRLRIAQVEARVELLRVVERADRDAGVADLAVDVGARIRVAAVERHAVEGRREPRGRLARRTAGGSVGWCARASPSPANMRVGSSFSRLNGNTPAVNGKLPGRFSRRR